MTAMRYAKFAAVSALAVAMLGARAESISEAIVSNAVEASLSTENFLSGEMLFRIGKGPVLTGYVAGVLDAGDLVGPPVSRYCLPSGVSNGEVNDAVLAYLANNADRRHLGASHLIRASIRSKWPCPEVMPGRNQSRKRFTPSM